MPLKCGIIDARQQLAIFEMSTDATGLDPLIAKFLRHFALQREPGILAALREETAELEMSIMQISAEQGLFMSFMARLLGVKQAIEVGVFTVYSALCIAQEMPADGTLVACDISAEWTAIAQRYWQQAGVDDRIDLRLAPAATTLETMLENGEGNSYDFAFIDADKESYKTYYELCLKLVRPGGVIMIDNIFMAGDVPDPDNQNETIQTVRSLTVQISTDERVDCSLLPIGDGLLLASKRNH